MILEDGWRTPRAAKTQLAGPSSAKGPARCHTPRPISPTGRPTSRPSSTDTCRNVNHEDSRKRTRESSLSPAPFAMPPIVPAAHRTNQQCAKPARQPRSVLPHDLPTTRRAQSRAPLDNRRRWTRSGLCDFAGGRDGGNPNFVTRF